MRRLRSCFKQAADSVFDTLLEVLGLENEWLVACNKKIVHNAMKKKSNTVKTDLTAFHDQRE